MDRTLRESLRSVFSGKLVLLLLGLVFTPILVRLLTQEEFGIYSIVMSVFSILTLIAQFGIPDALRKNLAEAQDSYRKRTIVGSSLILAVGLGLVMATIILFMRNLSIIAIPAGIIGILSIAVFFKTPFEILNGVLYGQLREDISEKLRIGQKATFFAAALVAAYLGYGLFGVFVGLAVSNIVFAGFSLTIISQTLQLQFPSISTFKTRSATLLSYGGLQFIGGLSAMLLYHADILMVGYFRGPDATALYKAALVSAEFLWFIPNIFQVVYLQHTARLYGKSDIEGITSNLESGLQYVSLSLILLAVGLFSLAPSFLEIYFGARYAQASLVLRILIIGTFFFGISRLLIPVFQATGSIKHTELTTLIALVVNLVLNVTFIPRFGIQGAAVATSISYLVIFLGAIIIWNNSEFRLPQPRLVFSLTILCFSFGVIFLKLPRLIDIGPLISLLVLPLLGFCIFIILANYLGLIELKKFIN